MKKINLPVFQTELLLVSHAASSLPSRQLYARVMDNSQPASSERCSESTIPQLPVTQPGTKEQQPLVQFLFVMCLAPAQDNEYVMRENYILCMKPTICAALSCLSYIKWAADKDITCLEHTSSQKIGRQRCFTCSQDPWARAGSALARTTTGQWPRPATRPHLVPVPRRHACE